MKKIQFDQQKETPHPKKKINKKKKTAKKWKVIELEKIWRVKLKNPTFMKTSWSRSVDKH